MKGWNGIKSVHYLLTEPHKRIRIYKQLHSYNEIMIITQLEIVLIHSPPTSGGVVVLKTGRRMVIGSNPDRASRPSRSEFSVVFSETRVNTG